MVLVLLSLPDTSTDEQIDEAYENETEPATATDKEEDGAAEKETPDATSDDDAPEPRGNAMKVLRKRKAKTESAYAEAV